MQATDLAAAVSDDSAALTILAPVDTAFLAIPREDLEQLVSSRDILTQVRIHHNTTLLYVVAYNAAVQTHIIASKASCPSVVVYE